MVGGDETVGQGLGAGVGETGVATGGVAVPGPVQEGVSGLIRMGPQVETVGDGIGAPVGHADRPGHRVGAEVGQQCGDRLDLFVDVVQGSGSGGR
jgi:hypothetical protein